MPQDIPDEFALEHRTLQASVTDRLRALILSHRLRPGQRLVQDELAEQLGVSRTPLRAALETLVSEGLVSFSPYKGACVAKLSISDADDIYSVRIALESYAGYLATQHISEEELERMEVLLGQMGRDLAQGKLSHLMELNRQFNCILFAASRQRRLYELAVQYMHLADLIGVCTSAWGGWPPTLSPRTGNSWRLFVAVIPQRLSN